MHTMKKQNIIRKSNAKTAVMLLDGTEPNKAEKVWRPAAHYVSVCSRDPPGFV